MQRLRPNSACETKIEPKLFLKVSELAHKVQYNIPSSLTASFLSSASADYYFLFLWWST